MNGSMMFGVFVVWLIGIGIGLAILFLVIRGAVISAGRVLGREAGLIAPKPAVASAPPRKPTQLEPTPDNPRPNSAAVKDMLREQRKQ